MYSVHNIHSVLTLPSLQPATTPPGGFSSPLVLLDVQPTSDLWTDALLGPLVTLTQFRTAKEAVALVNHSKQGVGCSVWSEKNSLILQVELLLIVIFSQN